MKHRLLKYSILVGLLGVFCACQKETVLYDFSKNPGVHATFQATKISLPEISAETGGKVTVPLYRGNTKGDASVEVEIKGGEDVITPSSNKFEFKDGENIAYIDLSFDFAVLTPKPITVSFSILKEEDMALNGINQASVTLNKKLNWEEVGIGEYFSEFFEEGWEQPLYKAEEGDYYMLPDCWVRGYNVTFFCDGENFELYTSDFGYNYGGLGHVILNYVEYKIAEVDGDLTLSLTVEYTLPSIEYSLGTASESLILPEDFSF